MTKTVILGSGMAAWGAYDCLTENGIQPTLFDAKPIPAGHTASYRLDNGFIFDDGPHISFTTNEKIQNLFAEQVDGNFESFGAYVDNYYFGQWVEHPVIVNLNGLPTSLIDQVLSDFKLVHGAEDPKIDNYLDWLVATYGKTYADEFPARYGKKYHTCSAEIMNTDWLGPRLYQPDLEEVERGAYEQGSANVHYVKKFRYPKKGGFQSYLDPFLEKSKPNLGFKAIEIDTSTKLVKFENGVIEKYSHLISTVPLPALIPIIKDVPADVLAASQRLACTQCVLVNVGVNRDDLSPATWRYIYDENIESVRLSFPHMLSPSVVPAGHGSVQVELYYSDKYKPFDGDFEGAIETAVQDLITLGVLNNQEEIVYKEARLSPWANVIFDLDTNAALEAVHGYLDEVGITYCGRYGEWAYIWTDESYLSGYNQTAKILNR